MTKALLPALALAALASGCFVNSNAEMAAIERDTALLGGKNIQQWLGRAPACPATDQLLPDEREGYLVPTQVPPNVQQNSSDGACNNKIPTQDYTLMSPDGTQTQVQFTEPPLPPVQLFECQWPHAIRALRGSPVRLRVVDAGGYYQAAQLCRVTR